MYNVYLFQPQYTLEIDNTSQYWIPYSVGCLWSYAQQFHWVNENYILKDLIFKRDPIDLIADKLEDPFICGFSCYVWNEQYCIALAKKIKSKWPNCKIVFGGPQVSTDMTTYEFIDTLILNEGEQVFTDILKLALSNSKIENLYFGSRMVNLDIPSPYASGIFNNIILQNPEAKWHMTMETNRGCPYQCTFCDWGSLTYSKIKQFQISRVEEDIKWAKNHPVTYIYCADANFGIFKDRDLEIAKLFKKYLLDSDVEAINLQFAKNSNVQVMKIAKTIERLCRGVTVSVQSLNDLTLANIKRKNLKINDMVEVFKLSEEYNVKTYSEFILGLPDETLETWKQGLTDILEYGQHQSIDVWFCHVLKNSELGNFNSKHKFGIKTINVKDYLALHNNARNDIIEYIEIITSTNTMSPDEIVEGFMYAWMIINFHVAGYSQIFAKQARIKNISFRTFYDYFYQQLKNSVFNEQYISLKQHIKHYLQTGESPLKNIHSVIHTFSANFIYEHKELAFSLANDVYMFLTGEKNTDVLELQKLFIYDQKVNYPVVTNVDTTTYTINSQITKNNFNFYNSRRKGLLKNIISPINENL